MSNPRYFHLYDANKVVRVYSDGKMELYVKKTKRWEENYVYCNIYEGEEPCREVTEKEAQEIITSNN